MKVSEVLAIPIVCVALLLGYVLVLDAWTITFLNISPMGLNVLYLGIWVLAALAASVLGQHGFGKGLGESVEGDVVIALGYSVFFTVLALVVFTVVYQGFVGITCCGIVSGVSVSAEIYTISMSAFGAYLASLGQHLRRSRKL